MYNKKVQSLRKLRSVPFLASPKKAISPVVATALLLVVAVVAVVGFQGWFSDFQSKLFVKTETDSQDSVSQSGIETIVGNILYFKTGLENVSIQSVSIDGVDCNFSENISGITNIDVSSCLENLTTVTPEILVVSDKGIYSKKIYLKDVEIVIIPPPLSCTLDEITINHNFNYTFYNSSLVPFGDSCSSEVRVCDDGTYLGNDSFNHSSCSVIGQDITPVSFSFTNQTAVNLSIKIISNSVTPTGYDGPLSIGIIGDGTPMLSINGGSWITSGNLNPGDSLRISLNSSSASLTRRTTVLNLGDYSTNWSVTTKLETLASCKAIRDIGVNSTGIYTIDPDGIGVGNAPFNVYCDMTSYGGGWTLVARFTNGCYTYSRSAVGTLTSPSQGTCAKLSDANINLLAGPTTGVFWGWHDPTAYPLSGPRFLKIISSEFNANAADSGLIQQCSCSPNGPWSANYGYHGTMAGVYTHSAGWQCVTIGATGCNATNTNGNDLFLYQHSIGIGGTFPADPHGIAGGTAGYLYVR